MKNINPLGLFDDHFLMEKLTKLGDPLQKLSEFIDWKIRKKWKKSDFVLKIITLDVLPQF